MRHKIATHQWLRRLFATLFALAPITQSLATITAVEVQGEVKVTNNVNALVAFATVPPSETIALADGSKVTLVDDQRKQVTKLEGPGTFKRDSKGVWLPVAGPSTKNVAQSKSEPLPSKFKDLQLNTKDVAQASLQLRNGDGSNGAAAQGQINILTPAGAYLPTEAISLEWAPIAGAESYVVEVATQQGTSVLQRQLEGTTTQLVIQSASAQPSLIRPGARYRYAITAKLKDGTTAYGWREFSIVEANIARRLELARPAKEASATEHRIYVLALLARDLKQAAASYSKLQQP
jgi:hypothetical protein